MKLASIYIFSSLLFFCSCSSNNQKGDLISHSDPGIGALEHMYGGESNSKGQVVISQNQKLVKAYLKHRPDFNLLPGDDIICSKKTQHQMDPKHLLVLFSCKNTLVADCDGCQVVWGAADLVKNSSQAWEIKNAVPFIGSLGNYGELPQSTFLKVGSDTWALRFDDMITVRGTTNKVMNLHSLEKNFEKILSVDIEGNNSGACGVKVGKPCYKFFSEIKPNTDSEGYGNIRIWYNGTEPIPGDNSIIRSAEKLVKLCMTDGIYQRKCL